MKELFELWHKYGNKVVIFFVAVYFYMENQKLDNKIEQVEARLYDCYEDKATIRNAPPITRKELSNKTHLVAVLPSKCKSIKECLA